MGGWGGGTPKRKLAVAMPELKADKETKRIRRDIKTQTVISNYFLKLDEDNRPGRENSELSEVIKGPDGGGDAVHFQFSSASRLRRNSNV